MDQRIDLITLRVEDVEAATRHYTEGLGWQPILAVPGEVTFFQCARGQALSVWDATAFDADAGPDVHVSFMLAHNVSGEDEVRAVVDQMVSAGGSVVKAPQHAEWGGYHSLVIDRFGVAWEIAHNPGWNVADDGTVTLGPVEL